MQAFDEAVLRAMFTGGAELRSLARVLTQLGGWFWLLPVTLLAAGWLAIRRTPGKAVTLLAVTLIGRLIVEGMKLGFARPRPDLFEHAASVHSLSFPSGHAANSMIVYLTIAILAVGTRRWVIAAVALALAIGLTRPVLGVHWPSDVVAGWAFGAAWTLGALRLLRPWWTGRLGSRPA